MILIECQMDLVVPELGNIPHIATHHKIYTDLKRVDGKLTYNKLSVEQWTDLRHKKYIKG